MRYVFLLAGLLIAPILGAAEPNEDKLEAILKELRILNERVAQLEKRMETVESVVNELDVLKLDSKTIRQRPFLKAVPRGPKEIIRLQNEEPGELLKNIHERERELRKSFEVATLPR